MNLTMRSLLAALLVSGLSKVATGEPGLLCTRPHPTNPYFTYGICEPIEVTPSGSFADYENNGKPALLRIAARVAQLKGERCKTITKGAAGNRFTVKNCANGFYHINAPCELFGGSVPYPSDSSPVDPTKNKGCPLTHGGTNPIHIGTGNKFETIPVVPAQGAVSVGFSLFYNSQGGAGQQWTHSYSRHVHDTSWPGLAAMGQTFETLPPDVVALQHLADDGHITSFTNFVDWALERTLNDRWSPEIGAKQRLESVYGDSGRLTGLKLTTPSGDIEYYDLFGRLAAVDIPGRPRLRFEYDPTSGKLVRVFDGFRTHLSIEWGATGNIPIRVMAGSGANYDIEHDGERVLAIRQPDATLGDDSDNPKRIFHYENTLFPHHLTGVTDENGNRRATWEYDAEGRATSSQHAGGADSHVVRYNADGTTSVTDALGRERTYDLTVLYGVVKPAAVAGGVCPDCGTQAAAYAYDLGGHIASGTDHNGNVTTYQRDAAGREHSRTEAAGTVQARTITTTWDTVLNKRLVVEEPGRVTTYVYDGQGRLLSTQTQATP